MSRDTLICLALACVVLLLYAPVRHHEFINYDDPGYVEEEHVRQGLTADNVRWAFTTFQFSNYHPLTWLSHMADVSLFGPDNAGAHHLTSVALHALNSVLLYLVFRAMTGRAVESICVAALWAVHPLRVESVAWVAERKDVLSGTFFLLTIACYVQFARRPSVFAYSGSLVCFVLGLLSKSMLVTLPCVLLLIDFWPLRRDGRVKRRTLVLEKAPFAVLTLAFSLLTVLAQRQGGAMAATEHYPMALRLGNAFAAMAGYVRTTVWPSGLTVFYPYYGVIEGTRLSIAAVVAGVALVVGGVLLGLLSWRRERAVLTGWLWFCGMLVPVIGLVQVGRQSMADRYTYLPHIGLMTALVWGVSTIVRGSATAGRIAIAVACVAAIALAIRSRDQLSHWHDSGTLFTHAMSVTDRNPVAYSNLALHLLNQGDAEGALRLFVEATRLVPREPGPYYHAGRVLAQLGRHEEALTYFRKSLELNEADFVSHYDLAVELAEHGRPAEALPHFERAIELRPSLPQPHYAYSLALAQAGRAADSASAYRRYVQLARARGMQPLPIPATNPDNR